MPFSQILLSTPISWRGRWWDSEMLLDQCLSMGHRLVTVSRSFDRALASTLEELWCEWSAILALTANVPTIRSFPFKWLCTCMLFHTYKDVEVETTQTVRRTLNQHTAFLPIQLDVKAKCKKIRIHRASRKGISLPNIIPLIKPMSKCRFYDFTHKKTQKGRINGCDPGEGAVLWINLQRGW